MLESLHKENWLPFIKQTFSCVVEPDQSIAFELLEVTSLGEKSGAAREPYSLVFRGPAESVLEQGIVPLRHPELGEIAIFLVPIGPDSQGMRYEAVFT